MIIWTDVLVPRKHQKIVTLGPELETAALLAAWQKYATSFLNKIRITCPFFFFNFRAEKSLMVFSFVSAISVGTLIERKFIRTFKIHKTGLFHKYFHYILYHLVIKTRFRSGLSLCNKQLHCVHLESAKQTRLSVNLVCLRRGAYSSQSRNLSLWLEDFHPEKAFTMIVVQCLPDYKAFLRKCIFIYGLWD